MTRPIGAELAFALALALERSEGDIQQALGLLRDTRHEGVASAESLLARAISRLEMMRMALGRRDDGPILS